MHNSTPEYAYQISSKPLGPQERELKENRERKRKRKAPKVFK
jgi:hypothetical protein